MCNFIMAPSHFIPSKEYDADWFLYIMMILQLEHLKTDHADKENKLNNQIASSKNLLACFWKKK